MIDSFQAKPWKVNYSPQQLDKQQNQQSRNIFVDIDE